jgi:hypothetical protein
MKRLRSLCQLSTADILSVTPRNHSRQAPERRLERDVRWSIVTLSSEIMGQGYTLTETAELLNLCPRTLRQWQADCRSNRLQVPLWGRPLLRASIHERNQVIDLLDELGPATGLPTLRECFPHMARAELQDILRRYRRLWKKLHVQALHRLRWPIPGRVWAMDFTDAPGPIDGLYPHVLAVRDLASGNQLLWLPVPQMTAAVTIEALTMLFTIHGPPLVLKSDNGSAFIADITQELGTPWRVVPLFSPYYLPRYNGAIEAGIRSLKTRTEMQATRQGHPGLWTWDDAAAAQLDANATARPRGPHGPTPDQLWNDRTTVTAQERDIFQAVLERRRTEARMEQGEPLKGLLSPKNQRSLDRKAIRRALCELGYLLFSRRRIPLAIKKQKVTNI